MSAVIPHSAEVEKARNEFDSLKNDIFNIIADHSNKRAAAMREGSIHDILSVISAEMSYAIAQRNTHVAARLATLAADIIQAEADLRLHEARDYERRFGNAG